MRGPAVLLVEDDPDIRDFAMTALTWEGYAVAAAAQVEEGLALAADLHPALILLDHVGDGGSALFVDGYRRQTGPLAPIVLWSAWPNPDAVADKLAVAGVLPKPTDLEALLATVRRFIGPPTDRAGRSADS